MTKLKHFLSVADFDKNELQEMLSLAKALKKERSELSGNDPVLERKTLAMIFQKPSLRTRVSFDVAMRQLGGDALYLGPSEIGFGKRESIADIARVLSGYVSGIMARVFDHTDLMELCKWSSVPVINGLSDYNHPCQAMADALTIQEHLGNIEGRRVVYVGDGNNVSLSLMMICAKLGAHFIMSNPEGYGMTEKDFIMAETFAAASGGSVSKITDPKAAAKNADVLYGDCWVSMGQEEETAQRQLVFPQYQINSELLTYAKPTCIVLHCLPAHRGEEITDEVLDGVQSRVFPQAHNRLHAQKAILYTLMVHC